MDPAKVVGMLHSVFGTNSNTSAMTRQERKLASSFIQLLQQAADCEMEIDEGEEVIDTDEDYEEDGGNIDWLDEEAGFEEGMTFSGGQFVGVNEIRAALVHYRGTDKGYRSLRSQNTFSRFIRTENDLTKLREFERLGEIRRTRASSLRLLAESLKEQVEDMMKKGISLHDFDLRQLALKLNKEIFKVSNFVASPSWITRFKQKCGYCSRRVTKFIAKKNFSTQDAIDGAAKEFVEEVRDLMRTVSLSLICNADQSGFVKEMHPTRSLAPVGARSVPRIAQSMSAMSHSSSLMPILYADGRLAEKLLVVLQEPKGCFPQRGHFRAENLEVMAGTSHIMTKKHMLDWIGTCLFSPNSPRDILLLVDSWTSFKDHAAMQSAVPPGCNLVVKNIPAGTTSAIQPLDVFFSGLSSKWSRGLHPMLRCMIFRLLCTNATTSSSCTVWSTDSSLLPSSSNSCPIHGMRRVTWITTLDHLRLQSKYAFPKEQQLQPAVTLDAPNMPLSDVHIVQNITVLTILSSTATSVKPV